MTKKCEKKIVQTKRRRMKEKMMRCLIPFLFLLLATSCGGDSDDSGGGGDSKSERHEYSEEATEGYLSGCIPSAQESADWSFTQASEYCNCTLYEIQGRWSEEYFEQN